MKRIILFILLAPIFVNGQNVGIGTDSPEASAKLEVQSTSGGILIPRLTSTERDAIPSPATGLLVFNSENSRFEFYDGIVWGPVAAATSSGSAISDDDGDTKVDVEQTADEDTIRIKVQNSEILKIDPQTLHLNAESNSTLLGLNAGKQLPASDSWNTFIGHRTGESTSTGISNTFIGAYSGSKNNKGNSNTFVGVIAGEENTGSNNVFLGNDAGRLSSEASDNSYVGVGAGSQNTGSRNISIGFFSSYTGSGSDNIGIGRRSLYTVGNGLSELLAIGDSTLYRNGQNATLPFQGIRNTAIGHKSLKKNRAGLNNTGLGYHSLENNDSGSGNTALGSNASNSNQIGSNNTAVGALSLYANQQGLSNTAIGNEAGRFTTGSRNTFIGNKSGNNNTDGSGNIFIGNQAGENETGSNQLMITNTSQKPALIHGDFENDHLIINGDLEVTGDFSSNSIDVSQITGILGNGYSAVFPVVLDNTVELEISGVNINSNVLIVNSVGFEIDTFSIANENCIFPESGFTMEFPLIFETDDASDISSLNSWLSNPDSRDMSLNIYDLQQTLTSRIFLYDYTIQSSEAGTDGRTRFTIAHNQIPNTTLDVEITPDFGTDLSFNPQTDKLVQISGVTSGFNPEVQVDYNKRIITLESTYNEGNGLLPWIESKALGSPDRKTLSIIETTDGTPSTETSREDFFEVIPFKYEVIYGFGLNTKIKTRIQLLYGCNEAG